MKKMWLMFYFVIILINPSQAQVDFSGLSINELMMLEKTAGDKNEAAKLHFKKIGGSWCLIKIQNEGNGGC